MTPSVRLASAAPLLRALTLAAVLAASLAPGAPPAAAQPAAAYDTTTVGGQPTVTVRDVDGSGITPDGRTAAVTWSPDYTWVLDGLVFVNDGQTLTLPPGTVVKGQAGQGADASALVVARGGRLEADGTPAEPIIFTAAEDDLTRTDDLPANFRGGWGGVILLGRARLNTLPNVLSIEGISLNDPRNQYGGTDDDDDSGTLRYVSIRHGGTIFEEDNEINGLTLGAVGRGTTIEYVEVYNNQDDGFEWFGGTVDAKHLVSVFATDDSFDMDQGYRGRMQYLLAIQNSAYADRAAEMDGGEGKYGGEARRPFATPQIYNATFIGSGLNGLGGTGLVMRDNFAGALYNSIVAGFPDEALFVEDVTGAVEDDSRARFEEGTLAVANNLFYEIGGTLLAGSGSVFGGLVANAPPFADALATALEARNQMAGALPVRALVRDGTGRLGRLDPRAAAPARAAALTPPPADGFFDRTDYAGAFGDADWAQAWAFIGEGGATYPGLGLLSSDGG